uniref:Uncharacterized protein n=1 Tax=Aegilops tauschii subsp. strangulata TaxID=200361 RepID=A0A453JZK0_AEGTS
ATQYATLLSSLSHHSILAWLACRGDEGGRAASFLRPSDEAIRKACPEEARRKVMYCSMTSQQARPSVNWEDIKLETLTRLQELVDLRPNLDCLLKNRLPRHKPTPQDVIPLGLRGSRRYRRKRVNHKPAHDLAYFVLHKRYQTQDFCLCVLFYREYAISSTFTQIPFSCAGCPLLIR